MFSPWVHQNEYTLRRPTQLTHQSGISRTQWTQHSCHQEEPPPVLLWRHDKGALELYRTESKWCSLHIEQYQARSLDDPGPGEYGVCHPRHPGTGAVTHHTHQLIWCSNTENRTCTAHVPLFSSMVASMCHVWASQDGWDTVQTGGHYSRPGLWYW